MDRILGLRPGLWRDPFIEWLISREVNQPIVGVRNPVLHMFLYPGFWQKGRDRTANNGWELTIAGIYSFRRGHINDPDGDIVGDTEGWGLSLPANDYIRFSADHARVPKARGIGSEEKWSFWLAAGPAWFR